MALDTTAGRLYVTLPDRGSVAVLDTEALSVSGIVAVGPAPRALAVDSQMGRAYVVNAGYTLSVVDGASLTAETLDLTLDPEGSAELVDVVINPTTHHLYVSGDQQKPATPSAEYVPNPVILVLDAADLEVIASATTEGVPGLMALDAEADRVYTFGYQGFRGGQGVLHEVDGATGEVRTISLGAEYSFMLQAETARAIDVDPQAGKVYLSLLYSSRPGLAVVDLATETATTLDLPGQASDLAVDSAGGRVYAVLDGSGDLWIVESASDEVQSVSVGQSLAAIALDASRGRVYLADRSADRLAIFDAAVGKVMETLAVGQGPIGLAADPIQRRVYVLNAGDGSVTVVQD